MEDPDSGPRKSHQTREAAAEVGIEAEEAQQAVGSCYGSGRRTFDASLEACVEEVCDVTFELATELVAADGD